MLDWNPDDPDTVKVHYDVAGWSIDQRAELSEALAEDELAHIWEGDEVVVPEELEDAVDALFARLEEALGPFAVALGADDDAVEYGLDEWPPGDRQTLTQALIESEIPHRWDDTTIFVAADAEEEVDDLLDSIEQGTLVLADGEGLAAAPEGALSNLFTRSDRLAKDPEDHGAADDLRELVGELDPATPPYGVSAATWTKALAAAGTLVELLDDEASASDIIGGAQELRGLVRQYV